MKWQLSQGTDKCRGKWVSSRGPSNHPNGETVLENMELDTAGDQSSWWEADPQAQMNSSTEITNSHTRDMDPKHRSMGSE